MNLYSNGGGFSMFNIICSLGGLVLICLVNYFLLFSNQPDHTISIDQYGYNKDS